METLHRLGTFFILVGLALLALFVVSILSKEIHGIYLLAALISFFAGYLFHRNKQVTESGRFKTLRRVTGRGRRHRAEGTNNNKKDNATPG